MALWNINKVIKYGRYLRAVLPEHPKASKRGYVGLHRVLMENILNRLLVDDEVVHHINGDGQDNRIENLQVMTRADHQSLHRREQSRNATWGKLVEYKCYGCGKLFERPYRNRDRTCKHFCSQHCVAKYAGQFK